MGTDNKEVAWILLDENTKPIRILLEERSKLCIQTLNLKPYEAAFPNGHK